MEEEDVLDRSRRHSYLISLGSQKGSITPSVATSTINDNVSEMGREAVCKSDNEDALYEIPIARKRCSTTVSLEEIALQKEGNMAVPESIESGSTKSDDGRPEETGLPSEPPKEVESPPPQPEQAESPPTPPKEVESPPPQPEQAETPPTPPKEVESPPPQPEQAESPPTPPKEVESPPPQPEQAESPPTPPKEVESPPTPPKEVESPPPQPEQAESPPTPPKEVESPPPQPEQAESPPTPPKEVESPPPQPEQVDSLSPPTELTRTESPPPKTKVGDGVNLDTKDMIKKNVVRGDIIDYADYMIPSRIHHDKNEPEDKNTEAIIIEEMSGMARIQIVEEKVKTESLDDYESPEQLLHKLQKAQIDKVQHHVPDKLQIDTEQHHVPDKLQIDTEQHHVPDKVQIDTEQHHVPDKVQIDEVQHHVPEKVQIDEVQHHVPDKVQIDKVQYHIPDKLQSVTNLEAEVSRLIEILKVDEVRMFKETAWGKEAIQEIVRLEDIKLDLEKQIVAGGDAPAVKTVLKDIIMEGDAKDEEIMKMTTMFHQTESELQNNKQEIHFGHKMINELNVEVEFARKKYISKLDELEKKKEQTAVLKNQLTMVTSHLSQVHMQNQSLQTKVKQFNNDIEALVAKKFDLEAHIDQERHSKDQKEKLYRKVVEELQQKTLHLSSLEVQVLHARARLEKAEKIQKDINKKLHTLKNDAKELTEKIMQLNNSIANDKMSLDKIKEKTSVMQEEFTAEWHEFDSLKKEETQIIKSINDERKIVDGLRTQKQEVEHSLESLADTLTTTQEDRDSQLVQKKTLQDLISSLNIDITLNKEELEILKNKLLEKEEMVADVDECCSLRVASLKNIMMCQQSYRELINKAYERDLQLARDEAANLSEKLEKKATQVQMYNKAVEDLQEIFAYSFIKITNLDKY